MEADQPCHLADDGLSERQCAISRRAHGLRALHIKQSKLARLLLSGPDEGGTVAPGHGNFQPVQSGGSQNAANGTQCESLGVIVPAQVCQPHVHAIALHVSGKDFGSLVVGQVTGWARDAAPEVWRIPS
jgi:hypothetical protein